MHEVFLGGFYKYTSRCTGRAAIYITLVKTKPDKETAGLGADVSKNTRYAYINIERTINVWIKYTRTINDNKSTLTHLFERLQNTRQLIDHPRFIRIKEILIR